MINSMWKDTQLNDNLSDQCEGRKKVGEQVAQSIGQELESLGEATQRPSHSIFMGIPCGVYWRYNEKVSGQRAFEST